MNEEVKSAVRVLEMLELLARSTRPVSLKEVALELGYPKSSAHQLLATLVSRGYAMREDGERYRLNEACRSGPGWTGGGDAQLIALAQPVMRQLRDQCGETVLLGVRMRDGRLKTIAKCVGSMPVRYDSELAGGLPSYCTALGRVLLAYWDPVLTDRHLARERIVRLTDHTTVDRVRIRSLIQDARREGFAISDQEMDADGCGVAAPIYDAGGTVVAALDIAVVAQRFASRKQSLLDLVVAHARTISARNGFRPEAHGEAGA
ncbi:IclR family transcriptional regulator [Labrys monachus]|uniref:DNA-binding IclR family transcriptional regulator n=1 Tax=Labrys monachus TaxID=217067 RepID=A0ABU0FDW6_9HYPH|nr:IclR family transcriptional regulator [Labrys monachus]MDQ0392803.1 DNA-binding IclR family transcriptional regulator [Labrys monachus]